MIRKSIRSILRSSGIEIIRANAVNSQRGQLARIINHSKSNIVFDIGANEGQFGIGLREFGYKGRIVSFEPMTKAHSKLVDVAARDEKWSVHERVAIGDKVGRVKLNIAGNSVSSSILSMCESHLKAAPDSCYVGSESAEVIRLDSIANSYLDSNSRLFVKIDTQGYEWQVLDGASRTLDRTYGLLCEISFVALYEKQKLWLEIVDRLNAAGFDLWAMQRGFTDLQTGRTLQADAVFLRASV